MSRRVAVLHYYVVQCGVPRLPSAHTKYGWLRQREMRGGVDDLDRIGLW